MYYLFRWGPKPNPNSCPFVVTQPLPNYVAASFEHPRSISTEPQNRAIRPSRLPEPSFLTADSESCCLFLNSEGAQNPVFYHNFNFQYHPALLSFIKVRLSIPQRLPSKAPPLPPFPCNTADTLSQPKWDMFRKCLFPYPKSPLILFLLYTTHYVLFFHPVAAEIATWDSSVPESARSPFSGITYPPPGIAIPGTAALMPSFRAGQSDPILSQPLLKPDFSPSALAMKTPQIEFPAMLHCSAPRNGHTHDAGRDVHQRRCGAGGTRPHPLQRRRLRRCFQFLFCCFRQTQKGYFRSLDIRTILAGFLTRILLKVKSNHFPPSHMLVLVFV